MQIRRIEGALREAYADFLRRRPEALVYQSLPYQDLLCAMLGVRNESVAACDADGMIHGALPLLASDGPWGTVYNSLPFYGSNGGLLTDTPPAREALLTWYNTLSLAPSTASATIIANPLLDDGTVNGVTHNRLDSRIGQFSPLNSDAQRQMEGFHYKTRNMIRKAEKSGVSVTVENDAIDFLRAVHLENMAALGGIPKPAGFFDLFPSFFAEDSHYRIYVARINGERVAALLLFYFNSTVEYFIPVIQKDYRDQQPMSLLVYTAMLEAARSGYSWWNWGGTWHTQEGVYRFKSRWGTIDRPYNYYIQLNRIELENHPRAEILAAHPFFYVLPFAAKAA